MKDSIKAMFKAIYQENPDAYYVSPGRVNIIGEHTDYNGGLVMPFCIQLGISAAVRFRQDDTVRVHSENLKDLGIVSFHLFELDYDPNRDFANYVSGVFKALKADGHTLDHGFDLAISSNLPVGGGLSSSAALLVLITKILSDHYTLNLSGEAIALLAKRVENQYIGVNCGIMDQFIIANGKRDRAIYLASDTLEYAYVPCELKDYRFLLINSNVTRKLTESKYNTRQLETQTLLHILQEHTPIQHVCELSPEDYATYETYVTQPELKRRFKHLVDENERVKQARDALIDEDFVRLGKLLTAAHVSLRDLYEVSSEPLDRLVELALSSGSLGSRMIGGGFGGSTLNIVRATEVERFIKTFSDRYQDIYGREPLIHLVDVAGGVHAL